MGRVEDLLYGRKDKKGRVERLLEERKYGRVERLLGIPEKKKVVKPVQPNLDGTKAEVPKLVLSKVLANPENSVAAYVRKSLVQGKNPVQEMLDNAYEKEIEEAKNLDVDATNERLDKINKALVLLYSQDKKTQAEKERMSALKEEKRSLEKKLKRSAEIKQQENNEAKTYTLGDINKELAALTTKFEESESKYTNEYWDNRLEEEQVKIYVDAAKTYWTNNPTEAPEGDWDAEAKRIYKAVKNNEVVDNRIPASAVPSNIGTIALQIVDAEREDHETEAKQKRTDNIFKRYNIDPANFNQQDFLDWLENNNMQVYDADNSGLSYGSKVEGGFLGFGGKKLATQQQIEDADVLYELAGNNYRTDLAQSDEGAFWSAVGGFSDGLFFGGLTALGDHMAKSDYEKAGLDPESYVSPTQAWAKTKSENAVAHFAGDLAGSVVTLGPLSKGVSAATKGVGWIANSPQWVQSAINSGITFAVAGGAETAFDGGDLKDVLISTGVNFVGGAVGGSLSSKVGTLGERILFNKGLQHKIIPEMIRNGFSSAAFAGGKVASTYFLYPEEYRPTAEEMAKDIGVAFAFGAISSGINTMKASAQNKKYLDDLYQKMASDYENMAKANISSKSDISGIRKFAKNVVSYSNAMEAYLTGKEFNATIDGNTYTFTPNKVRLVGQANYVKSILSELQTIRNSANAVLNGVGTPTTDLATTTPTSSGATTLAVTPTLPSGGANSVFAFTGGDFTQAEGVVNGDGSVYNQGTAKGSDLSGQGEEYGVGEGYRGAGSDVLQKFNEQESEFGGSSKVRKNNDNAIEDGTLRLTSISDKRISQEDLVIPRKGSAAQYAKEQADSYGLICHIVSDEAFDRIGAKDDAYSIGGQIYIRESAKAYGKSGYIPHEASHTMRQTNYAPYMNFVGSLSEKVNMSSQYTRDVLSKVAGHREFDSVELTPKQTVKLWDEFNATVYGSIKVAEEQGIDYKGFLGKVFYDVDAYVAEMDKLHNNFKSERSLSNAEEMARNDGGGYTEGYRPSDGYNDGRERARIQTEGKENGGTIDSGRADARGNGQGGTVSPVESIAEAYGATGVERNAIYSAYELGRQNTPREVVSLEGPAQEEAYNAGRIEYIRNMPNEMSTESDTQADKLTHEEEGAVVSYKGGGSYNLNAKLRAGAELTAEEAETVKNLDSALGKLPKYQGKVYRNISLDYLSESEYNEFLQLHAEGEDVHYSAYTSTSISKEGYPIDGERVVHFEIESVTGADLDGYGNNFESEILIPRDAIFTVERIETGADGCPVIVMKEVSGNAEQIYPGTVGRHSGRNTESGEGKSARRDSQPSMQQVHKEEQGTSGVQSLSERTSEGIYGEQRDLSGVSIEGNGEINYAEEIHLRRGGERVDGTDTAGEVRSVESGPGRNQSRDETSRPADRGAASLTLGEEVSPASQGIAGGTRNKNIRLVTGGTTEKLSFAKQLAKERGLRLVPFAGGNLEIKGKNGENISARAYISGDRMFVRVDHPEFDSYQLTRHEVGHDMIDKGEIDLDSVRERIGREKIDRVSELYAAAYAMNGYKMDPDEIFVEIVCDSLGDMNIFAQTFDENKVAEFLDETSSAVRETKAEPQQGRAPPVGASFSRETGRRAQRGRSIETEIMENNRFERLRQFHGDLPAQWFAFTRDYFYLYSNESQTDYTVLVKARITARNSGTIDSFVKELENGTYGSTEALDYWTAYFRRGKGRDSWYYVGSGRGRTADRADGVDGRTERVGWQRSENDLGYSGKSGGDSQQEQIETEANKVKNENAPPVGAKFSREVSGRTERYSLRDDAVAEVEKAISQKGYTNEVRLTDSSPSILSSQKGVKNLPMVMKSSHIRENVLTKAEAQALGLKVSKNINYHGLGKKLFLEVISGLDDVSEAYRGTPNAENPERRENYFLLISKCYDSNRDTINVPVYVNEHALYNRVFIDTNKIATVFGRKNLRTYIKNQVEKGNLVKIKNRSLKASESPSPIDDHYSNDASDKDDVSLKTKLNATKSSIPGETSSSNSISNFNKKVNGKTSLDVKPVNATPEQASLLSDVQDSVRYSYKNLVLKPDMVIAEIDDSKAYEVNSLTRKQIVRDSLSNAKKIGRTNERGEVFVYVDDIDEEVLISTHGLQHGLDRRLQQNAAVTINAGKVLKNAICINELVPNKSNVNESYVLLSTAKNKQGQVYVVEFVVNKYTNHLTSVDVLYSLNTKKEESAVLNAPAFTESPLRITDSKISIADLLDLSRMYFPDVLPESVLKHFGYSSRPKGKLGESALYSLDLKTPDATPEQASLLSDVQDSVRTAVREELNRMGEEYGWIPRGEKATREVWIPKKTADDKYVSQTVRTILEAKATPEDILPTVEELVANGEFSYDRYTDEEAIAEAEGTIKNLGWAEALKKWTVASSKGQISKKQTALGWALYNNAASSGDTATAMSILNDIIGNQRSAAQALQATRILKKLSPETQLYQVQKSVARLQEEINEKYGSKKAPELVISQELAEEFIRAETEEERNEVLKEIYKDIGRQLPSNWMDKWRAWRYLSMLGSLKTHGKNIIGNAAFAPVVVAKDLTATAIEKVVYTVSGGKTERTKGFGRDFNKLLSAAWNDYKGVSDIVSGERKYNDGVNTVKAIEDGRKIFKSKILTPVEKLRKLNTAALEAEDMWFAQPHYAFALAQYASANGITADQIKSGKNIEKARDYAAHEAQKATYRDTNAFSAFVSSRASESGENSGMKKFGNLIVDAVLPFRKTPANILVRGVEYSPLGLLKGLSYDLFQVGRGEKSAAEAIDNISAGLTGTGLMALGALLAALGLVRGHGSDDEKKREFEELMGHQAYALELPGGISITLDWLAPEALPFFAGVNMYEMRTEKKEDGEALSVSDFLSPIARITEPMLEMSCLQSLNDIFESVGYATSNDMDSLSTSIINSLVGYGMQGIPTIGGQAERTGEGVRYTTHTQKGEFLSPDMQYVLGKATAKIPGVDLYQIPYVDAWGRKEETGGLFERAGNNLLNPAYTSRIEESSMEKELLRLYETTGESGVLPKRAAKTLTVNSEKKHLTGDEYVRYATKKGQTSRILLEALVKNSAYKSASDGEKVKMVGFAYDYANQLAKSEISGETPEKWVLNCQKAKKRGVSEEVFIALKVQTADIESLKDSDGKTITNSESLLKMQHIYSVSGLSDEQRRLLFEAFGVGKTVRHYNKTLVNQKLAEMRKK